jgi:hypothetical protein
VPTFNAAPKGFQRLGVALPAQLVKPGYLGEINGSQRAAWSKAIKVFDEGAGQSKQIALFPADRLAPALDCDVVSIRLLAPGLTPRVVLEKLATMQMIDVELPTTDDRVVVLSRYTEPEKDQLLLLRQLKLQLPAQPPPKITARSSREPA